MAKSPLTLAPVRAYNRLLIDAFAAGPCSCHRCIEGDFDESQYAQEHTHNIDGELFNRRFATTTHSDVMGALSGAWKAFYKPEKVKPSELDEAVEAAPAPAPEMATRGPLDLPAIQAFTDADAERFLIPLLLGAQCVIEREGALIFNPDPPSGAA